MASPVQGTTLPCAVTFNADGLSDKSGTLRCIHASEAGVVYYVTYQDGEGGIRGIWLKAADIEVSA